MEYIAILIIETLILISIFLINKIATDAINSIDGNNNKVKCNKCPYDNNIEICKICIAEQLKEK